jgi:hypothetical protein
LVPLSTSVNLRWTIPLNRELLCAGETIGGGVQWSAAVQPAHGLQGQHHSTRQAWHRSPEKVKEKYANVTRGFSFGRQSYHPPQKKKKNFN